MQSLLMAGPTIHINAHLKRLKQSRPNMEQPIRHDWFVPVFLSSLPILTLDRLYTITGQDDATSAVLTVSPSVAGSLIGAGPTGAPLQPLFGNTDFKAYNIDFQNRAVRLPLTQTSQLCTFIQANFAISQALVTDISYANASFYGCTFASYQDTWYTGRNASTYVLGGTIFGQTDCT